MQAGKQNEIDIMTAVSGQKYEDIDSKWKSHLKKMFPDIESGDVVHTYFYHDTHAKPDIVITVKNKSIKLSIKSGKNPSCHLENFSDFMSFLIKNGVPNRIIRILSFYQFGRSEKLSNDGKPFSREELQTNFKQYVKEASDYFLDHKQIVGKIIYRTIIRGIRKNVDPIDYFYYGSVKRGFLLSREEIYKEIIEDPFVESRAIHFYGLVFQPCGRKETREDRLFVRIKWPILSVRFYDDDFINKYS